MQRPTFRDLSDSNLQRAYERNEAGVEVWDLTQWALAMIGEAGEACNAVKKLNRIEVGDPATKPEELSDLQNALADELADIVIYADLLAQRAGINLGHAVAEKFNRTSVKVGCKTMFGAVAGCDWRRS